ncbi:SCO2525 family SAM-dependent methyltransferase [Streptomyces sp. NPDC001795]|uniref:SCO2525 family SAM-dependent methyltransferase n=1 Tax=Streptomyces sp. NPDC001795 TaxID=3154525 RepID=UPI00332B6967
MTFRSPGGTQLNADVSWAEFDPIAYVDHNYRDLQAEDAEILRTVRDHFGGHFRGEGGGRVSGIDVGAGANLYPALAMLPWCSDITLLERSPANVRYLESQVKSYDEHWDQFWRILRKHAAYAAFDRDTDPRARFRQIVQPQPGNLFDLVHHEGQWSMGTMFFVAESMTTSHDEFRRGVECFLRALAPGAPFAAAFMEHSKGYHAGEHFFPACDVGESDVRQSVLPFVEGIPTVRRLQASAAVREGYSGMIIAFGHRKSDSDIPTD